MIELKTDIVDILGSTSCELTVKLTITEKSPLIKLPKFSVSSSSKYIYKKHSKSYGNPWLLRSLSVTLLDFWDEKNIPALWFKNSAAKYALWMISWPLAMVLLNIGDGDYGILDPTLSLVPHTPSEMFVK